MSQALSVARAAGIPSKSKVTICGWKRLRRPLARQRPPMSQGDACAISRTTRASERCPLKPHQLDSSSYGLDPCFQVRGRTSAPDSQLTRDVRDLFALLKETKRILSLRPSSGLPTPCAFPCAFALAMPSRSSSSVISRSNWAIAANLACLPYETLVRGNESTAAAQCPPVTEC
jgi:hypothetical protein